ncbi:DUF3280 domain-containing protein [Azospirillum canadense]|uniref:DUF3280 domain-containing protein n=1 Tax=Azospirillum canadense TaxID=403962 RepID=UPI002226B809|nr:DUF3280 domain-containing protein [Azospirillum canadense]MCW2241298.1 hypothetical protein [Azospirillum canadense]
MRICVAAFIVLAVPFAPAMADAPPKVLVFELELVDTSQEGQQPDHPGRLERVTALLRDGLKEGGRYAVTAVRDSAVAAEVPPSLQSCNGCEVDLGRRAGADIVVTGFIHKISTLILNIQITMRRVSTNDIVAVGNADIRGDNERSWRRGVEWLLRHRLMTAEEP